MGTLVDSDLVRVGLLIFSFFAAKQFLVLVTRLPPDRYGEPWILLECIRSPGTRFWVPLILVPPLAVACFKWRRCVSGWTDFTHGKEMRILLGTAAVLLAWTHSTYGYNYFVDRWHLMDRAAVIFFCILFLFRPVFVFPFLVALMTVVWQTGLSGGWLSWASIELPLHLLILFGAFWFLDILLGPGWMRTRTFLFAVPCLMAAHYWPSGIGKVRIGWLFHDQLHYLLASTYSNGWVGFLSPERVGSIMAWIAPWNIVLKTVTLVAECVVPVLLLLGRRPAIVGTVVWFFFHLSVFALTGIFFWQWMVLMICFGGLIARTGWYPASGLDRTGFRVAGAALIVSGSMWLAVTPLVWMDSRVNYVYRFTATCDGGRTFTLPPRFFAPFDYPFTMSRFDYLCDRRSLGIVWGATGLETARALQAIQEDEEVFALERRSGYIASDRVKREWFTGFIQRFVANHNRNHSRDAPRVFSRFAAPRLLWTFERGDAYPGYGRIDSVRIVRETWFCGGNLPRIIEETGVMTIQIPSSNRDEGDPESGQN